MIDLRDRFSIFTAIEDVERFDNCIALPFVPWSVYSHRTERLVQKALPKLQDYHPQFVLLNEDDEPTRMTLSSWFPDRFQPTVAQGAGSLIWLKGGAPVESRHGGPYLTEYEILRTSHTSWTQHK